jgi:hypothetical protein
MATLLWVALVVLLTTGLACAQSRQLVVQVTLSEELSEALRVQYAHLTDAQIIQLYAQGLTESASKVVEESNASANRVLGQRLQRATTLTTQQKDAIEAILDTQPNSR